MDPAKRLKNDYCSSVIMKAYWVKTYPTQHRHWVWMLYYHNQRQRECTIYISPRNKLMENQWAGCQILISFSGHKTQMTAKSVFLSSGCFSGWQQKSDQMKFVYSVGYKSNTVQKGRTPVDSSILTTHFIIELHFNNGFANGRHGSPHVDIFSFIFQPAAMCLGAGEAS